ncbi:MAG: molybdopterin-guanine dinucleotide biosynthesis protein MobB [Planctomycetes bacterium]|nr:molybdopterin-guanine dinucleotide biosynthesis protein MobB [Planctomycetota bacterium]
MANGDRGTVTGTRGAEQPKVLLVVAAASGAGKTTLLESLIPRLIAGGLRVAAVKRTHHDVELDVPGKDSNRLRRAGASPVILRGPTTTTVIAQSVGVGSGSAGGVGGGVTGDDIHSLVAALSAFGPLDLVLVEGGRDLPRHARIEVVAPGGSAVSDPELVIATVWSGNDEACTSGRTPAFRRDDVDGVAAFVLRWANI